MFTYTCKNLYMHVCIPHTHVKAFFPWASWISFLMGREWPENVPSKYRVDAKTAGFGLVALWF